MSEREAILNWIDQTGYPFELDVGEAFRQSNWEVEHARWYKDLFTEKWRELDVLSTIYGADDEGNAYGSVTLAVECKVSHENPWVVFAAPKPLRDGFSLWNWGTVDQLSRDISFVASIRKVRPPSILGLTSHFGHGIVKAFGDMKSGNPTSPFSALRGVVGAVAALGTESAHFFDQAGDNYACLQFVIPLLVLRGSLYEYRFDDSDDDRLKQVDSTVLSLASPFDGQQVLVRVITEAGVDPFLDEATRDAIRFSTEISELADDVRALRRGRLSRESGASLGK